MESRGCAAVRDGILVFAAYSLLTLGAFRQVAEHPCSVSTPTSDAFGNIWALTWVARHLTRPATIFAANIYYPDPAGLAYTEGLFAQALQAAPLLAIGLPPVGAYNAVWLLTFPLSGLGAYLLARHFWENRAGAFLAGLAYAFSAYRFERLAHVQSLSIQWLPLGLLLLLRALRRPAPANLAGCAAFVLLQVLSSGYYAALMAPAVGVTLLFGWRGAARGAVVRVLCVLALTAVLALPFFVPYLTLARDLGLARGEQQVVHWSARWSSYLRPSSLTPVPTLRALAPFVPAGQPCHPGTVVLVLAVLGIALRRSWYAAAIAAVGFALSLGPEVSLGGLTFPGPYELLRPLPGFRMLRTPVRMAPLALIGLGLLAAGAWRELDRRSAAFRRWSWLLLALALAESLPSQGALVAFGAMPEAPPSARWLAGAPSGAVLKLPWRRYEGRALYDSIPHGLPLVNGWGAFEAPYSVRIAQAGGHWPAEWAVRVLRYYGIRYLLVRGDEIPPGPERDEQLSPASMPPGVSLAASLGSDFIFVITPDGPSSRLPREFTMPEGARRRRRAFP